MQIVVAAFLAVAFNVFPLAIPQGFAVQLTGAFDEGRRPKIFAPPQTVSMNKDAESLILISRPEVTGHGPPKTGVLAPVPQGQRLLIFQSHRLLKILMPPSGAVFASQPFGAPAPLDAEKHPVFTDLQVANALISDVAKVYVTQWHYFDGAYSGTELWSFYDENGRWLPVPALDSVQRGYNLIVTASSGDEQVAYVVNHEDAPDYVGSDAQTGLTDRDEAWIKDGASETRLGNGTVSAISNHVYVGYDTHFSPAQPHFVKAPDAFEWVHGRKSDLGHGLLWAVNQTGVIVGDNRSSVTSPGQPIAWYRGRLVSLSHLAGSAFGINDRNQIVGDIETRGGFLATISDRGASLVMLDNELVSVAHGWHIEHAYSIASNGSILAIGKFKNEPERMVILIPDP